MVDVTALRTRTRIPCPQKTRTATHEALPGLHRLPAAPRATLHRFTRAVRGRHRALPPLKC